MTTQNEEARSEVKKWSSWMSDAKQRTGAINSYPNTLKELESRRGTSKSVPCAAHLFIGFGSVSIHRRAPFNLAYENIPSSLLFKPI